MSLLRQISDSEYLEFGLTGTQTKEIQQLQQELELAPYNTKYLYRPSFVATLDEKQRQKKLLQVRVSVYGYFWAKWGKDKTQRRTSTSARIVDNARAMVFEKTLV